MHHQPPGENLILDETVVTINGQPTKRQTAFGVVNAEDHVYSLCSPHPSRSGCNTQSIRCSCCVCFAVYRVGWVYTTQHLYQLISPDLRLRYIYVCMYVSMYESCIYMRADTPTIQYRKQKTGLRNRRDHNVKPGGDISTCCCRLEKNTRTPAETQQ